jgi:hypothetical protein
VVAKPITVGGEAESSRSSQAIGFGSWQSMQPANEPGVTMAYANDIGYETGQSSHGLGVAADDAGGEIFLDDEDEVLQQQMKAEDVDGDADDINSSDSDEEDDQDEAPIPKEWNQDFSNLMRVNEGHDSVWEYHPNSISVGSLYPDKQRLQVHSYLRKNDTFWVVSDHVQHTCIIRNQLMDHKNLSSTLVARLFHTQIVEGKAM